MPKETPPIILEKTGALSIITISRPRAANAINLQVAEELAGICAEINRDEETRAVIITAAGDKMFSAGTDQKALGSLLAGKTEIGLLSAATPVASLNIPVIAAINGDAIGQGLELALACDMRIAAETACFALTQVASGIIPWDGATQRLPRLVGRSKAMEMILTGQAIDAAEACRIGLVNRVFPAKELLPQAIKMGQIIASAAPLAVRYVKEAINNGLDMTLQQGLHLEADLYFLLHTTEDRTEGIRAFREKRPPRFRGK